MWNRRCLSRHAGRIQFHYFIAHQGRWTRRQNRFGMGCGRNGIIDHPHCAAMAFEIPS